MLSLHDALPICALDGYSGYPITLLACKMLLHVMARPGELRLARWAAFDFEKAVWTVPPERMKMRRPHYVTLSRQVIELLEELRPYGGGRAVESRVGEVCGCAGELVGVPWNEQKK